MQGVIRMTENKRFTVRDRWIKDNCIGKLLNFDFNTITDANLCCKLLNQLEYEKKQNGKIASRYIEENEQLKQQIKELQAKNDDIEWLKNNTVWEQMPSNIRTSFSTTTVENPYCDKRRIKKR